jgi:hypothetical protein
VRGEHVCAREKMGGLEREGEECVCEREKG